MASTRKLFRVVVQTQARCTHERCGKRTSRLRAGLVWLFVFSLIALGLSSATFAQDAGGGGAAADLIEVVEAEGHGVGGAGVVGGDGGGIGLEATDGVVEI